MRGIERDVRTPGLQYRKTQTRASIDRGRQIATSRSSPLQQQRVVPQEHSHTNQVRVGEAAARLSDCERLRCPRCLRFKKPCNVPSLS